MPERDPDEHLKLARWCLSQNMQAEAKAQLQAVLAAEPEVERSQGDARLDRGRRGAGRAAQVDPALVQTGGRDVGRRAAAAARCPARPRSTPAVLREREQELGVSGLP